MGIIEAIGQFFRSIGSVAEATEKRDELLNSPDQQANAAASTEQAIKSDAEKTVADQDLDKLRRNLSE